MAVAEDGELFLEGNSQRIRRRQWVCRQQPPSLDRPSEVHKELPYRGKAKLWEREGSHGSSPRGNGCGTHGYGYGQRGYGGCGKHGDGYGSGSAVTQMGYGGCGTHGGSGYAVRYGGCGTHGDGYGSGRIAPIRIPDLAP